jgi:hypothetical protein
VHEVLLSRVFLLCDRNRGADDAAPRLYTEFSHLFLRPYPHGHEVLRRKAIHCQWMEALASILARNGRIDGLKESPERSLLCVQAAHPKTARLQTVESANPTPPYGPLGHPVASR